MKNQEKRPPVGELIVYLGNLFEVTELLNCFRVLITSPVTGARDCICDNQAVPITDLHPICQQHLLSQLG
jgi:hypothetical protein